jgi:tetratricopeptide (TPR) repeat protein
MEQMTSEQNAQSLLRSAIRAAQAGNRGEAHQLLRQVIDADPSDEMAWLWLAGVAEHPREKQVALNRVEQLNPDHPGLPGARAWLEERQSPQVRPTEDTDITLPSRAMLFGDLGEDDTQDVTTPSITPAEKQPRTRRRWLTLLLVLAVIVAVALLAFMVWVRVSAAQSDLSLAATPTPDNAQRAVALQPKLNAAIADSQWEDVIAVLQVMRALDASNTALNHDAASAYYQMALARRDGGNLQEALEALDESLKSIPDAPSVALERRLLDALVRGVRHYEAGDWQAAIRVLTPVYREDPSYLGVTEALHSAYYNLGMARLEAGDLAGAQESYQSAVDLIPERLLARQKLEEVSWLLLPPTPTPIPTATATQTPITTPTPSVTPTPEPRPKRIVVDISEQRMYVHEGDTLLWNWVVSTGEPGKDTAVGSFSVRSKVAMAYASSWNLDMPYWLGIYQSGPLENGIHALPTQRATGVKLWDGYLGQRVSYGCIILSDENARTLYAWAELGVPVDIQW